MEGVRTASNERSEKKELIIAVACAVGTDNSIVKEELCKQLESFLFNVHEIKISKSLLEPQTSSIEKQKCTEGKSEGRINTLMDVGNRLRKAAYDNRIAEDYSILAQGVAGKIWEDNYNSKVEFGKRGVAYFIDSLKHEDEVKKLREIYSSKFFLFAINEILPQTP